MCERACAKMFSVYFGVLISCMSTYVVNAQFYYMVPAAPQQAPAPTYYSTSFGDNGQFPFAQPTAMQYFTRSFGPSQAYYNTEQTFGPNAASSIGYQTFADNNLLQPQVGVQQQSRAQIPTNTVFQTGSTDQFRGFAYHTQLTNGGSANVFFLTGPEAHQVRQLQGFPSLSNQNKTDSQVTQKARTLASNTVDSNGTDKNQQQQITDTLTGPPPGPSFEAIRSFFENPQAGFQQFYSPNGQLFARTEQNTNFNVPASTVILPNPISIQSFGNLPLINGRFSTVVNATESNATSAKTDDKGEEVAESMNTDIKISPNESTTLPPVGETITVSSTTLSSSEDTGSTTVSTTTEKSEKESTTKEEPSVKKSRSVKTETKESTTINTDSTTEASKDATSTTKKN